MESLDSSPCLYLLEGCVMRSWIDVDLNALSHNYQVLKNQSQKEIFGVVKDNAYGHGIVEIAKHLESLKIPLLCVFSQEEALELRSKGIKTDILVFGFTPLELIKSNDFIYTLPSMDWFHQSLESNLKLRLHIEVNTGMNRIGLKRLDDLQEVLQSHHTIEGIYTHFASPSNIQAGKQQAETFMNLLDHIDYDFKWIHLGNAPREILVEYPIVNAARFGLGLYGYREGFSQLQPILSFHTNVEFVDQALKGQTIGYDHTYKVEEDLTYGTIPLGYSDGFDMRQALSPLYIDGKFQAVLGKVCMNQTMLELDNPTISLVEVFGKNRTLEKVSSETGISIYVLLTCLHEKINRNYKK